MTGGRFDARVGVVHPQQMPSAFVGTSGFASPSCRSDLRAATGASEDLLRGYSQRFEVLEMDSCFYRPPNRDTVRSWADATPADFRLSVRVPRDVTHVDRLKDASGVQRYLDTLEPLDGRLRALLFTVAPSMECDMRRLRAVLGALPEGVLSAWECRHPSWSEPEVVEVMGAYGAAVAGVETEDGLSGSVCLGEDTPAPPFAYVRFRRDSYRAADLVSWGKMLRRCLRSGRDVYAFFRQSAEAMAYAQAMIELLQDEEPASAGAA
ncbi:MAG TPA: DUF72 domain-containing protein [Actinomycetota bacterium]|nr:DUF72 domain-containing protein [Actinomycetota bacterium]